MPASARIFISCVSDEFGNYRDAIRQDLTRPNLDTKIQEDFIASGGATLEKIDDYIKHCEAVIHIAGDMTGSMANELSLQYIAKTYPDFGNRFPALQQVLAKETTLSYTQWEAYLAAYHGKKIFVATPSANAKRNDRYKKDNTQAALQLVHLNSLRELGYYDEITFSTEDELVKKLYRSKLGDLLNAIPKIKAVNLPYQSIGPSFKGREAVIKDLEEMLSVETSGVRTVAVHGLGGMGKTRLAVEYAWQYQQDYSALLFITAASPELLRTNIAGLSGPQALNLAEQEQKEEDVKYAAVINWLNQYAGWLLVIDNVDIRESAKSVEDILSRLQHGDVLITTRIDTWSLQIKKKRLDVLDREDARDFLLESTTNSREKTKKDSELAEQIADDLGCLALALEQARAYIVTKELSFEKYRKNWEKSKVDVLSWFDEQQMQYPKSVAITWQTSFNQLSGEATTLLNRLAWLAPEPIPKTLLEVEWRDNENIDELNAWEELKRYSLATSTEDKKAFTLHKLVQDVARGQMDETATSQTLSDAVHWMDRAFTGNAININTWPYLEPLIPHVLSLAEHMQTREMDVPISRLMGKVAVIFCVKAQYKLSEPLMRRALEIDEKKYGPETPEVSIDLNNLAQLLYETNRWQDAEPLIKRSLEIDEKTFGPNHPKVAIRLNNLAAIYKTISRWQDAEPLMRRALEIDEKHFGENDANVARDLNNLAQLLKATGRLAEAEPLMRRALEIDEKINEPGHPDIARDLNNLAQLLQDTGRWQEAESLMIRTLEIDESNFGPNHPDVATDLNNLGQLFKATGRLAEAEPLMRRALEIDEKSFGPNHPNVARDLNNLAQLLQDTGRWQEAEPLMIRALEIDEKSFGPNHPDLAVDLSNLGLLFHNTNRLPEAEPLLQRALIIFWNSLGINHPSTQTVFRNYVILLTDMGYSQEQIVGIFSSIFSEK